jgi:DNA polymerase III subunit gamma/tau
MNFYQKYRPAKISELDLLGVRKTLSDLLSGKSNLQAFLFVGPRGAGKTSAARILAKTTNCEKPDKDGEACGKCKSCVSVEKGNTVDIIEIDAASHRGIDDIRELRDRVKLAPVSLARKIYIIDEVHMLTKEAFNALLKILEEPPEFVNFVLCTTEDHKVPETIASRCSKVVFVKANKEEIKRSLLKVVEGEKLKIDQTAVDLLSESVDGSFREGHKILEQLVSSSSTLITEENVRLVLGLVRGGLIKSVFEMINQGKADDLIEVIHEAEASGVDPVEFIKNCLSFLREKYEEEIKTGKNTLITVKLINDLSDLGGKIKFALDPFLLIEVVLLEGGGVKEENCQPLVKERTQEKKISSPKDTVIDVRTVNVPVKKNVSVGDVGKVKDEWGRLIEDLKDKNHGVAGLLRSAKPIGLFDECLEVEVFYQFHKDQLEQDVKRVMIEEGMMNLWGIKKVNFNLGESGGRVATKADEKLMRNAEEVFG